MFLCLMWIGSHKEYRGFLSHDKLICWITACSERPEHHDKANLHHMLPNPEYVNTTLLADGTSLVPKLLFAPVHKFPLPRFHSFLYSAVNDALTLHPSENGEAWWLRIWEGLAWTSDFIETKLETAASGLPMGYSFSTGRWSIIFLLHRTISSHSSQSPAQGNFPRMLLLF